MEDPKESIERSVITNKQISQSQWIQGYLEIICIFITRNTLLGNEIKKIPMNIT